MKPRRKPDGGIEIPLDCPFCGSRSNMEVNPVKRVYHCWACDRGGAVSDEDCGVLTRMAGLSSFQLPATTEFVPPAATGTLPQAACREIRRRGFDPDMLIREFDVRWDGERLCWPAGAGWARRAIWPWHEPKVLLVPPRGLIGQHRLVPGSRVVLVEGDYKAAAIPRPFVGVGLMGVGITQPQIDILVESRPLSVAILLDGGKDQEAEEVAHELRLLSPRILRGLPEGKGPDDIPRREVVRLMEDT